MATTELHKIPDTILSRAQVFELRTIGTRAITDQLRRIAQAEGVETTEEALALVARAAEGSMRDAQSALDQVFAFGNGKVDAQQVSDVLGLVARELLLDVLDIVAREDAPRVFDVAARLVESGHDLRHVCRELSRLVRDLMVLQVDPQRTADPDFAIEGDGERLRTLAQAFSREDLLRAFDLIAKLEADVRVATQPRYHLEMALLRWVHLRKLVPIASLIEALEQGGPLPRTSAPAVAAGRSTAGPPAPSRPAAAPPQAPAVPAASARPAASAGSPGLLVSDVSEGALERFRDALLAEIKRTQPAAIHAMVFMSARRVEVAPPAVTFVYESRSKAIAGQFEALRNSLDELAARLAGRPMQVTARDEAAAASAKSTPAATAAAEKERLKAEVMKEPVVQTLLEVFPADIRDVQEIEDGK
jgi:DNA polymerase-3 subunit gamma/tau